MLGVGDLSNKKTCEGSEHQNVKKPKEDQSYQKKKKFWWGRGRRSCLQGNGDRSLVHR